MQTYQTKRKAPDRAVPPVQEAAPSKSEMLHLSGAGAPQPMSPALREKFEPGFSADFSNIRISRGHIPEELGVQAVAQGTDILLDQSAGMDVLGHELAHVVQQAQGRVEGGFPVVENAALEHEADVMGARAASGLSAQMGSENGFGGEAMSIAPMSAASAPAQCKSREEKKAEKKQKRMDAHAARMKEVLQSKPGTRSGAFDKGALDSALVDVGTNGMAFVADKKAGGESLGNQFSYFRTEGVTDPTTGRKEADERTKFFEQLRNAGRDMNTQYMAALTEDHQAVPWIQEATYKHLRSAADDNGNQTAQQNLQSYDQQTASDLALYLSMMEGNADMMSAMRSTVDKVYNPMIASGLVTGKEEASSRALNDIFLRSLGPDSLVVGGLKWGEDPNGKYSPQVRAEQKAKLRVQAMMSNQSSALASITDPTEEEEKHDGSAAVRQVMRDFFIRNGFMDDPATAPATPAQPTAPAPQAAPPQPVAPPQPTVQAQPTAPAQQAVVPPAQLPTAAIPLQTAQHTPPPLPARPRVMPHPNLQNFRRPGSPPPPPAPVARRPVVPNAKLLWDQFNRQRG